MGRKERAGGRSRRAKAEEQEQKNHSTAKPEDMEQKRGSSRAQAWEQEENTTDQGAKAAGREQKNRSGKSTAAKTQEQAPGKALGKTPGKTSRQGPWPATEHPGMFWEASDDRKTCPTQL